jgi:A/G-specific adenine glycosylase
VTVAAADLPLPSIHATVLDWYAAKGRDLAFRRTTDPWAILVSEVMAQQTQAARAAEAWTRFMASYPTPRALASASPSAVIRAWRGLGYNRRALALRAAAVMIVDEHGGCVPENLEGLIRLPGIGPYTARAVLAIAFGRHVSGLDTNLRRVIGRAFAIDTATPRVFQSFADSIVPQGHAAAWTHSLMDIGAAFCRPREPRCEACPLRAGCRFAAASTADSRAPAPAPRRPTPRFPSTSRWLRGRILDRLRDAPDAAWVTFDAAIGTHDVDAVTLALSGLATEHLLELDGTPTRARLPTGFSLDRNSRDASPRVMTIAP